MKIAMIAVLAFGLALGGCGGGKHDPAAQPSATPDREAALVKYAQCMRTNGVTDFPDPEGGKLQLQARRGSDLDPANPTYKSAQQACKAVEPPGLQQQGQDPQQQAQALKFSACMRQNGVPGMPDPQADGRMLIEPGTGVDPGSAAFKSAQAKCQSLMPGGAAHD